MADDLRERIRRGDLAALADPSLPLHLLAEPRADWWREGRVQCAFALVRECAWALRGRREELTAVVHAWARLVAREATVGPNWATRMRALRTNLSTVRVAESVESLVRELAPRVEGFSVTSLALSLAGQLLPLLPPGPEATALEAALATVERYAIA